MTFSKELTIYLYLLEVQAVKNSSEAFKALPRCRKNALESTKGACPYVV